MSAKEQLQRSIFHLLKHNKHGSYETQGAREKVLMQAAAELTAGHLKLKHIGGLKQKHVIYLNEKWQERNLTPATIKNRNSHLRWACEVLGKTDVVPSNDALGVGKRHYSGNHNNKAIDIDKVNFSHITNRHI